MPRTDRRTHAEARGGSAYVVRYDRAGKWWIERPFTDPERVRVSVARAASTALLFELHGGRIYRGLPGGRVFDRLVDLVG